MEIPFPIEELNTLEEGLREGITWNECVAEFLGITESMVDKL